MRILQLLPELKVGGVERGTIDLSEYLVSQGHESAVATQYQKSCQIWRRSETWHP